MISQSVTHVANGASVAFTFPFPVFETLDLEVLVNGVVQASGFSLVGIGSASGGAVRFDSAPADTTVVTLRRTGKVQVSGSDAPGFLESKVVAGTNISVTKTIDAAGEHLAIASTIDSATFATAAQGAKADSALQSSDIGVSIQAHDADLDWLAGNITAAGKALLDDADAAVQRATLGLGTAATKDVGTAANQVVQMDASGKLPAMDGLALTNLNAGALATGTVFAARLGSGAADASSFLRGDGTWAVPSDGLARTLSVVGAASNVIMNIPSATASATATADEVIVKTAAGGTAMCLASYSQSVNLSTTGAGGMDTGSAPASGYVCLYAIAKTDGTSSILACNVTTSSGVLYAGANMPSGYTYSAIIGVWGTDADGNFRVGRQIGRTVYFNPIAINFSVAGSLTSLAISTAVPPNAKACGGDMYSAGTAWNWTFLAANANGLGQVRWYYSSNGAAPFANMPISTSQTLYYQNVPSGQANGGNFQISSYSF